MRKCLIIAIFLLMPAYVLCTEFKQVDFNAQILNNETVKNYDPNTGRFKGTKSEIVSLDEAQRRVKITENAIKELKEKKSSSVNPSMFDDIGQENKNWNNIADIDKEISQLEKDLEEAKELVENNGVPLESEVENVIVSIRKELMQNISKDVSSDTIILNNLPYYPQDFSLPDVDNKNDGFAVFLKEKKVEALGNYLNAVPQLSYLFPSVKNSVLYHRGKDEN